MGKKKVKSNRGFSTTSVPSKNKSVSVEPISEPEKQLQPQEPEIEQPTQTEIPVVDYVQDESLAISVAKNQDKLECRQSLADYCLSLDLTAKQEHSLLSHLQPLVYQDQPKTFNNLQISYFRLLNAGFDATKVEEILTACPFDEFDDIIQWICLNFKVEDLPIGWTDKLEFSNTEISFSANTFNSNGFEVKPQSRTIEIEVEPETKHVEVQQSLSITQDSSVDAAFNKAWILNNYDSVFKC